LWAECDYDAAAITAAAQKLISSKPKSNSSGLAG